MAFSNEELLKLYTNMIRTKTLDEELLKASLDGRIPWAWHSGLGEEGIVGAMTFLRPDDYLTYTHRGCYAWVCKGMSMREVMAEQCGKATGCSRGKGGHHISKPSLGIMGRSGTQGGHFPMAVGLGIAAKLKGNGQVVLSCAGDGCFSRGTVHEALNTSSIHKLPVIWFCENNGFAVSTPQTQIWSIQDIADLSHVYGMPGVVVDGNDVVAVAEAVGEATARARSGAGPTMVEIKTYRLRGHTGDSPATLDVSGGYRTREEWESWKAKDPVKRFEDQLLSQGILTAEMTATIQAEADAEVADAVQFANDSPWPTVESAFEDVFAS